MKQAFLILTIAAALFLPATAQASCSGWLDCLLGMTERTEVRADRDVEQARIQAASAAEVARIQGEADARIKQAEAEVERVKQLRFESEAERDIAIAQANAKAEEYKAMIAGLTSEKIAGIQSNADTQIAALHAQAQIATAGILETGRTERWRVAFGWATVIVVVIALGLGWSHWIRRTQTVVLLPQAQTATCLPWYDETLEIVEVEHASVITRTR